MEDNEKTMAFVQWIAKQMGIEPEKAIEQIQQVMQTEDGQKQIGELYQQFEQQTSGNQMFKKGGKIDQLVTKYQYGGNFYKRWSSGDIAKLQTFLAGHGYDPGVINGKMGQSTINAIKRYQRAHNLKDDGLWGTNTNKEQKVLTSDVINKGVYLPSHKYEIGTARAYDNTPLATVKDLDPKQFQDLHVYYLNHPEEFFDENNKNASKFRQILHNSGDTGASIVNQIYGSLNSEERKNVLSRVKTGQIKSDELNASIYRAHEKTMPGLLAALTAPVALGEALTPLVGGATLAGSAGLIGTTAGGYIGGKIGKYAGEKYGDVVSKRKDENGYTDVYNDPIAANYGVAGAIYDPERTRNKYGAAGQAIGTIAGSVAGGYLGARGATATEAAIENRINRGTANLNYKTPKMAISEDMGEFGSTVMKPTSKKEARKAFKAGKRKYVTSDGKNRLGGPHQLKFRNLETGKILHPGRFADEPTIAAANARFNNENSPLVIRFGQQPNTGISSKLGNAYEVNPGGVWKVFSRVAPMGFWLGEGVNGILDKE